MKTTFQELNDNDEFTDSTGIKYRKIHTPKFDSPKYNAVVLEHEILGGRHVQIHPGQKVNKIVKLTKFGDMKVGDVFIVHGCAETKYYKMRLCQLGCYSLDGNIFHPNGVCEFLKTDEFEVVGHIDLTWHK